MTQLRRSVRKIEETIGLLQKNFECAICLELMRNPVTTKCGHIFCRLCLLETVGHRKDAPCPLCKVRFTKRSLQPLLRWNQMVGAVDKLMKAFAADTGAINSPTQRPVAVSTIRKPAPQIAVETAQQAKAVNQAKVLCRSSGKRRIKLRGREPIYMEVADDSESDSQDAQQATSRQRNNVKQPEDTTKYTKVRKDHVNDLDISSTRSSRVKDRQSKVAKNSSKQRLQTTVDGPLELLSNLNTAQALPNLKENTVGATSSNRRQRRSESRSKFKTRQSNTGNHEDSGTRAKSHGIESNFSQNQDPFIYVTPNNNASGVTWLEGNPENDHQNIPPKKGSDVGIDSSATGQSDKFGETSGMASECETRRREFSVDEDPSLQPDTKQKIEKWFQEQRTPVSIDLSVSQICSESVEDGLCGDAFQGDVFIEAVLEENVALSKKENPLLQNKVTAVNNEQESVHVGKQSAAEHEKEIIGDKINYGQLLQDNFTKDAVVIKPFKVYKSRSKKSRKSKDIRELDGAPPEVCQLEPMLFDLSQRDPVTGNADHPIDTAENVPPAKEMSSKHEQSMIKPVTRTYGKCITPTKMRKSKEDASFALVKTPPKEASAKFFVARGMKPPIHSKVEIFESAASPKDPYAFRISQQSPEKKKGHQGKGQKKGCLQLEMTSVQSEAGAGLTIKNKVQKKNLPDETPSSSQAEIQSFVEMLSMAEQHELVFSQQVREMAEQQRQLDKTQQEKVLQQQLDKAQQEQDNLDVQDLSDISIKGMKKWNCKEQTGFQEKPSKRQSKMSKLKRAKPDKKKNVLNIEKCEVIDLVQDHDEDCLEIVSTNVTVPIKPEITQENIQPTAHKTGIKKIDIKSTVSKVIESENEACQSEDKGRHLEDKVVQSADKVTQSDMFQGTEPRQHEGVCDSTNTIKDKVDVSAIPNAVDVVTQSKPSRKRGRRKLIVEEKAATQQEIRSKRTTAQPSWSGVTEMVKDLVPQAKLLQLEMSDTKGLRRSKRGLPAAQVEELADLTQEELLICDANTVDLNQDQYLEPCYEENKNKEQSELLAEKEVACPTNSYHHPPEMACVVDSTTTEHTLKEDQCSEPEVNPNEHKVSGSDRLSDDEFCLIKPGSVQREIVKDVTAELATDGPLVDSTTVAITVATIEEQPKPLTGQCILAVAKTNAKNLESIEEAVTEMSDDKAISNILANANRKEQLNEMCDEKHSSLISDSDGHVVEITQPFTHFPSNETGSFDEHSSQNLSAIVRTQRRTFSLSAQSPVSKKGHGTSSGKSAENGDDQILEALAQALKSDSLKDDLVDMDSLENNDMNSGVSNMDTNKPQEKTVIVALDEDQAELENITVDYVEDQYGLKSVANIKGQTQDENANERNRSNRKKRRGLKKRKMTAKKRGNANTEESRQSIDSQQTEIEVNDGKSDSALLVLNSPNKIVIPDSVEYQELVFRKPSQPLVESIKHVKEETVEVEEIPDSIGEILWPKSCTDVKVSDEAINQRSQESCASTQSESLIKVEARQVDNVNDNSETESDNIVELIHEVPGPRKQLRTHQVSPDISKHAKCSSSPNVPQVKQNYSDDSSDEDVRVTPQTGMRTIRGLAARKTPQMETLIAQIYSSHSNTSGSPALCKTELPIPTPNTKKPIGMGGVMSGLIVDTTKEFDTLPVSISRVIIPETPDVHGTLRSPTTRYGKKIIGGGIKKSPLFRVSETPATNFKSSPSNKRFQYATPQTLSVPAQSIIAETPVTIPKPHTTIPMLQEELTEDTGPQNSENILPPTPQVQQQRVECMLGSRLRNRRETKNIDQPDISENNEGQLDQTVLYVEIKEEEPAPLNDGAYVDDDGHYVVTALSTTVDHPVEIEDRDFNSPQEMQGVLKNIEEDLRPTPVKKETLTVSDDSDDDIFLPSLEPRQGISCLPLHGVTSGESDDELLDEVIHTKRKSWRNVIEDDLSADEGDIETDCSTPSRHNLTSSSAFSSQSDMQGTEQKEHLQEDVEKMEAEIAKIEAKLAVKNQHEKIPSEAPLEKLGVEPAIGSGNEPSLNSQHSNSSHHSQASHHSEHSHTISMYSQRGKHSDTSQHAKQSYGSQHSKQDGDGEACGSGHDEPEQDGKLQPPAFEKGNFSGKSITIIADSLPEPASPSVEFAQKLDVVDQSERTCQNLQDDEPTVIAQSQESIASHDASLASPRPTTSPTPTTIEMYKQQARSGNKTDTNSPTSFLNNYKKPGQSSPDKGGDTKQNKRKRRLDMDAADIEKPSGKVAKPCVLALETSMQVSGEKLSSTVKRVKVETDNNMSMATSVVTAQHSHHTSSLQIKTSPNVSSNSSFAPTEIELPARPQWCFVISGVKKTRVKSRIEKFRSLVSARESSRITQTVTHLIVSPAAAGKEQLFCQRTLKYFQAIAMRKWIVSAKWVTDSLAMGQLLPEDDYEIHGDTTDDTIHNGPRRSRVDGGTLFLGYEMHCMGTFSNISRDELRDLIELCGGHTVHEPTLFSFDLQQQQLLIVEPSCNPDLPVLKKLYQQYGVPILGKDWILDSVGQYNLQRRSHYMINLNPDSETETA